MTEGVEFDIIAQMLGVCGMIEVSARGHGEGKFSSVMGRDAT